MEAYDNHNEINIRYNAPSTPKSAKFSHQKSPLYERVPLDGAKDSIRIISLLPGEWNEPVRCSLTCYRCADEPEYEALSYCWGSMDTTKLVFVEGRLLPVTDNLLTALRYLRLESHPRSLWIDAICIDQSSATEREDQVSIMRDIYAASQETIIWLGESTFGTDLSFFACLVEADEDDIIEDSSLFDNTKAMMKDVRLTNVNITNLFLPTMQTHAILKPWFSRIWVIQEAAVSRKLIVQCGNRKIRLHHLMDYYFKNRGSNPSHGQYFMFGKDTASFERVEALHSLVHAGKGNSLDFRLSSLLSRLRRFEATHAVDKLFALYGLAHSDVTKLRLHPDYTNPVELVYTETTFAMLQSLGDPTALEVPRGRSSLRAVLPSYVPDWSDTSRLAGGGLTPESQGDRIPIHDQAELSETSDEESDDTSALAERARCSQSSNEQSQGETESIDSARSDMESSSASSESLIISQRFDVSNGSPLSEVSKDANNILSLQGFMFDDFQQLGSTLSELTMSAEPERLTKAQLDGFFKLFNSAPTFESFVWNHEDLTRIVANWDEILACYESFVEQNPDPYPTGQAKNHAYFLTLCAASYFRLTHDGSYRSAENVATSLEKWIKAWKESTTSFKFFYTYLLPLQNAWLKFQIWLLGWLNSRLAEWCRSEQFRHFQPRIISIIGFMYKCWRDEDLLMLTFDFVPSALEPTFNRRIAKTTKGYFALVPHETNSHDKVAILRGCRLPLVLRHKYGNVFELIGESYVHGIMFVNRWV